MHKDRGKGGRKKKSTFMYLCSFYQSGKHIRILSYFTSSEEIKKKKRNSEIAFPIERQNLGRSPVSSTLLHKVMSFTDQQTAKYF